MTRKQKLELTWIGKENRPRLEPRILLEEPDLQWGRSRGRCGNLAWTRQRSTSQSFNGAAAGGAAETVTALAIMKWDFATTNEIKDLRPSFIAVLQNGVYVLNGASAVVAAETRSTLRLRRKSAGFNGAAAGGAAETAVLKDAWPQYDWLQWGRSFGSCGNHNRFVDFRFRLRASMGPQLWELRKPCHQ